MNELRCLICKRDREGMLRMDHEKLVDDLIELFRECRDKIHTRRGGRKPVYGDDARAKVLSLRASGETYKNIASELGMSFSTVRRICSSLR